MAAFWKMNWWPLYTILFDQYNGSARILATGLMTMHINDVVHVNANEIVPVLGFVNGRLMATVCRFTIVHQLIWCPFNCQHLCGLMQCQVARHWFADIFLWEPNKNKTPLFSHCVGGFQIYRKHKNIILAVQQCFA